MVNYTKQDRKQVFGSEELDVKYMEKIRKVFDEKIRAITVGQKEKVFTAPLNRWVN